MPIFWRVSIINGCLILSKAFLASIELILYLSFNLSIRCITLIDLHILKNTYIPGINPSWLWYMTFLMCCWIMFAKIVLRIFASMFISDIGLQFSFLCVVFVWFSYQGDGGLVEWVWKCFFLCNFWKEF